jgi:uncharacterized protein (TIGR02270 family)
MAGPKITVIANILEEHLEELDFLWGQRQTALRSPKHTLRELRDLEERIEAHVQGLLVSPDHTVGLLEPGLSAEEPGPAFVAAYGLGRLNRPDMPERLMAAFLKAQGPALSGIRQAICQLPIAPFLTRVRQVLTAPPGTVSVLNEASVAEVLAFHNKLDIKSQQMDSFLRHENPVVRRVGWRAAGFLPVPRSLESYQAGLQDPGRAVRHEALLAAAWGRQSWLLGHLRRVAAKPTRDQAGALLVYAILAKPAEVGYLVPLGKATELGPERYRILGACGHPAVVEVLLAGIESKDLRAAAAAGAAFTKMTGADIDSGQRAAVPPADGHEPDEFEREFLDEVSVPSPDRARAHWEKVKNSFGNGTRWCRGTDLNRGANEEAVARLDLESRWEACLRGKFDGTWTAHPASVEAFPYKAPPPCREPDKPPGARETMRLQSPPAR